MQVTEDDDGAKNGRRTSTNGHPGLPGWKKAKRSPTSKLLMVAESCSRGGNRVGKKEEERGVPTWEDGTLNSAVSTFVISLPIL